MKSYIKEALESTLLSPLGEETIRTCIKDGRFILRHYDKEQVVHFPDEACTKMEMILSGKVSVERIGENGNLMVIAEFPRDEILGDQLKHYVNRTIRESMTHFLEYERKSQCSDCIVLPMSKTALAEKLGVQRTSLSRELARMRKEGLIDFEGRTVRITGLKNRKP